MGTSSSKPYKQPVEQVESSQQQLHKLPNYLGIPCEYEIMRMETNSSSVHTATSDVNAYLPYFREMYNVGNRLLTLKLIGSIHNYVTAKTMVKAQAIFRTNEPKLRSDESYTLQAVKSPLESGTFLNDVNFLSGTATGRTHTQHIFQMINDYASRGGRLRCIEIIGCCGDNSNPQDLRTMQTNSGLGHQYLKNKGCTVDLFFELPLHPYPEIFVYKAVPLRITTDLEKKIGPPLPFQDCMLQFDWLNVITQHLSSGWKMVDVFNDMSADTSFDMADLRTSSTCKMNVVFIFEKNQSRFHDNTPVYEGTMIEHNDLSETAELQSTENDTNWDTTLAVMGDAGWELVTLLQKSATITYEHFKRSPMLVFFQRAILTQSDVISSMPPLAEGLSIAQSAMTYHKPPDMPYQTQKPYMGYQIQQSDKGYEMPQPEMRCQMPQPDKGCQMPQPDKGCQMPQPDQGYQVQQPDMLYQIQQPDKWYKMPQGKTGSLVSHSSAGHSLPQENIDVPPPDYNQCL